jgi:putative ABC transport system permease protein
MSAFRRFVRRLLAFVRPAQPEHELAREIEAHLGLLEDDFRRRGLSAEEAQRAARRSLGHPERAKELHRDARSFVWLDDARRDVRYALRSLAKDRGFTTVAVLTLALGIGAVTTIFGGVNAVLLQPPPFPQAERLVFVWESIQTQRAGVTAPDWMDWQRDEGGRAFERLAAYAGTTLTLTGIDDPERVPARRVSAGYFRTLGVVPALGRDFTADDDRFGAPGTVLVSDAFWRRRFAADRALVGRTIALNGESRLVIGVLPPNVNLGERAEQLYIPLAIAPAEAASTGSHFLIVIGRLKPDTSRRQAEDVMATIARRLGDDRPHSNREVSVRLEGLHETLVGDLRQPLWFFMGAVSLLLLIVCANVANLQLVRTAARQREVAIRAAIGAGRSRLVRQFVIENLVLAAIGGAAGLLVALWSADLVPWLVPGTEPRLVGAGFDLGVAGFAGLVSLAAAVLFGVVPVWRVARRDLRELLSDGAPASAGVQRHRVSASFVVIETALALVLLVGAGLMLRSVTRLKAVDPGFRASDVLALRLALPEAGYPTPDHAIRFFEDVLGRIQALPGVISAAGTSTLPLRSAGSSLNAPIVGRPKPVAVAEFPRFFYRGVTPGYFDTLGVPIVRGRDLTVADRAGRPRAAVINETAARRYWPGADPIGARFEPDDGGDVAEIVGVVGDVKHLGLHQDAPAELFIAVAQAPDPYFRWTQRALDVVVRTAPGVDVTAPIRAAVREMDAALPVYLVMPLSAVVDESMAGSQRTMTLVAVCGAIALVLAALGMYGVVAAVVRGRTQEIGVRVTLGATRRDVIGLVIAGTLRLCAIGLVLGAIAAFSLRSFISTFLFGVASTDALTYVSGSAVLLAATLLASFMPARRALKVDPVKALRTN